MQSVGLTFRLEKLRYAVVLIKFLQIRFSLPKSSFPVLLFLFIFSILKSVPKHIENIRKIQDKLPYYIVDKVELYNYHMHYCCTYVNFKCKHDPTSKLIALD